MHLPQMRRTAHHEFSLDRPGYTPEILSSVQRQRLEYTQGEVNDHPGFKVTVSAIGGERQKRVSPFKIAHATECEVLGLHGRTSNP